MTVCVAAICQYPNDGGPMVIGCSDRMLTMGFTEYQPAQAKYYVFPGAQNLIALVAGNISPAIVVCDSVNRRLPTEPTTKVRAVAQMLSEEFAAHQRYRAQQEVLDPYGLTHKEFLQKQRQLDPDFVRRIANDLASIYLGVEIIVAGQDDEGSHIHVIRDRAEILRGEVPGTERVEDPIGFAAIGSGADHAYSQFTLANYDRRWSLGRALFLLYSARRRAQLAPGVGEAADWIWIMARGVAPVPAEIIDELDKQYKKVTRTEHQLRGKIDVELEAYFADRFKSQPPPPPVSGEPASLPPSTPGSSTPRPSPGSDVPPSTGK